MNLINYNLFFLSSKDIKCELQLSDVFLILLLYLICSFYMLAFLEVFLLY